MWTINHFIERIGQIVTVTWYLVLNKGGCWQKTVGHRQPGQLTKKKRVAGSNSNNDLTKNQ